MDILNGVRVLEFCRFISGPYATWLLSGLGAEVIKVEPPGGELDRSTLAVTEQGDSTTFLAWVGGKKCVTLDLRRGGAKAKDLFAKLVARSDVVVENLGPGVADEIGLTYERLSSFRPQIIAAHVNAFARRGPYAGSVGFDSTAQAMSGGMSITGYADEPLRSTTHYVDYGTASTLALGVVSALYDRQRTGKGRDVDVSMLGMAVTWSSNQISEYWTAGKERSPRRLGNRGYWTGFSDICKTKDGQWTFVTLLGPLLARFFRAIGREDLATDTRLRSDMQAFENRHLYDHVIRDWVAGKNLAELEQIAAELRIPVAPVLDYAEVPTHPQVIAERVFVDASKSDGSLTFRAASCPIQFGGQSRADSLTVSALGEHNDEIWGQLCGVDAEELAALKRDGVI